MFQLSTVLGWGGYMNKSGRKTPSPSPDSFSLSLRHAESRGSLLSTLGNTLMIAVTVKSIVCSETWDELLFLRRRLGSR